MFYSGISAKSLIEELKNTEIDIALDIPDSTYVAWLNSLQQLLYTEVIKEQKKVILDTAIYQNPIRLSALEADGENTPRFEDIHAIYANFDKKIVQLKKSTLTSGTIFYDTYYKENDNLGYKTREEPKSLTVIYIVKPALVTTTTHVNVNDVNIMVPVEFIDLVKAKLRGEAYKLANEDNLAAKWLNDYNVLLDTFRAWIADKAPNFGI